MSTPDYVGIAAVITSGGAVLVGLLNRRTQTTTERKVDDVHGEVKTSNGHTLGQLVEQNLPPTLDSSPAAVRVDDGQPAGRLQTLEELQQGVQDRPAEGKPEAG